MVERCVRDAEVVGSNPVASTGMKMPKALTIKSFGIFSYVRKRTGNSTRGGNFCESIIFDIDGTLLSEITKEIPQSALDALKKTAEKGNLTFINTGRTWSELPEELKKLPFSGFLCGCGTYLRRDGEILMHQTIPKKRCEEIPVILKECRIGMILEGTDNVYFRRRYPVFGRSSRPVPISLLSESDSRRQRRQKESFTINFVS